MTALTPKARGSPEPPALCPVCGHAVIERHSNLGSFWILRCAACDTAWRSNMYTPAHITLFYQQESYATHPFFSSSRRATFERALDQVESRVAVGRLLDVGCGPGGFLAVAAERRWDVYGVDLCAPLCEAAERIVGPGRVANLSFEEFDEPAGSYDALTMWDVIEHVLDPVAVIERARTLLRPGGVLVVCTPDLQSLLARTGRRLYRYSGGIWREPAHALHPRYHTFFFSEPSLDHLFRVSGMEVVHTYSQTAFVARKRLKPIKRAAVAMLERAAGPRDVRFERVAYACPAPADAARAERSEVIAHGDPSLA